MMRPTWNPLKPLAVALTLYVIVWVVVAVAISRAFTFS